MPIRVVTPSVNLPVALALALRHCRALHNEADLIQLYVEAATELVEDYTGRSLINKTYCLDTDSFEDVIRLKRTPVSAVNSVKYYNAANGLTTVNATNYLLNASTIPAQIEFIEAFSYPDVYNRFDAVQVEFVAGYGLVPSAVDPSLKLAVLELAHHVYENRVPIGDVKNVPIPYSLKHILRAKRV